MIEDSDRPTYHYLPPEGLLWDPTAAVFWNGRYHLFFLHSSWEESGPPRRSDGYIYKAWAHISSADLVRWEQHPNAIDRGQTGNLFLFNGTPTIIYPHSDLEGASCVAFNPDGDLERWQLHPENPVLRHADHELKGVDVTAWQEGEWCYALTGTRDTIDGGDAQHLFRSRDLAGWDYVDRFYRSERCWTDIDDDCACPDFFELGGKSMLLHFCHQRRAGSRYYLGRYENHSFHPDAFDRINWPGGNIHAPRAMLDGLGRRILFVNLNEGRKESACVASGWSGVLSLPVVISLPPDGSAVRGEPVPELQALRRDHQEHTDIAVAADTDVPLPVRGDCLELEVELEAGSAAEFGLKVRCAPDGSEETLVSFSSEPPTVRIDYREASLRDDLDYHHKGGVQVAPFPWQQGEPVTLRVFLDRSVLEVFVGDRRYLAQRIYPTHPEALDVKLFSRGGPTLVRRVQAWQMMPLNAQ